MAAITAGIDRNDEMTSLATYDYSHLLKNLCSSVIWQQPKPSCCFQRNWRFPPFWPRNVFCSFFQQRPQTVSTLETNIPSWNRQTNSTYLNSNFPYKTVCIFW